MSNRLVLIHTVTPLIDVFNKMGAELLPGVQLIHILDEPLLERVRQRGRLAAEDAARMQTHVTVAEQIKAQAVLVTCSTISPTVDEVRPKANIPVVKIDEAMITKAVEQGNTIGVVATNPTTLEPTRHLLQTQADAAVKTIDIKLVLVDQALSAFLSGDGATHDTLVAEAVLNLAQNVDVVVLAQASMARVLDVIPKNEHAVPILSSPHLALAQVKRILNA